VTRRAWLVGRIAALLAIVIVGTLAIFHYSSLGNMLASSPDPSAATARATTEATTVQAGSARTGHARAAHGAQAAGAQAAGAQTAGAQTGSAKTGSASSVSPSAGSAKSGSAKSGSSAASTSTASPGPAASQVPAAGAAPGSAPLHFRTLPPGAALPTGAQCAHWVNEHPQPENKAANKKDNHLTGQHVGAHFFSGGDSPQAQRRLAPRIDGNFTGTTKDILRWAACKWGINQNVVFAQAAVESWWQQGTLGDWANDPTQCPPGHKLGADGRSGLCPQSYGILQNRWPFEKSSWPGIGRSTAMNADTGYAIWRSCYDGFEPWLNTVEHHGTYRKGDMWGCVGRWFAGRWHTAPAQQYIGKVKTYEREKIWLTPDFQQGS
jgi:hypothetical protein